MANVPLVATSIGAEGLHLEHGRGFLLADDAASFAAAIEGLLRDRALWERVANATTDVTERHSEEAVAEALFTALDDVLAREPKPASLAAVVAAAAQPSHSLPGGAETRPGHREDARPVRRSRTPRSSSPTKGSRNCFACTAARCLRFRTTAPRTEKDVLAALGRFAREGAEVLVVPSVSLWWNDAFNALQPAIRKRFLEIASTDACAVYDLQRRPVELEQLVYERSRSQRRERRLRRTEDDRVLPPSVPPDSGERRLVGRRVHGVAQRRQRAAPVRRPPAAPPAVEPRLLRPPRTRDTRGAGRPGTRATGSQASATTTTGSQGSSCSSARSRRCSRAGGPTSPSASAGRTNRGRDVGTARNTTSSSHRATARRTTVGTSPGSFRPSATSGRSTSMASRSSSSTRAASCRTRRGPIEIWQGVGARGRASGDPSRVRRDRLGRRLGREPGRLRRQGALPAPVLDPRPAAAARRRTGEQPASTTISRHGARLPIRRRLTTTVTNASAPRGTTRPAAARTHGFSTTRTRPRTRSGWS